MYVFCKSSGCLDNLGQWSMKYTALYYWFFSDTLRALYLSDNDFEHLPPEIGNLKNLQIVSKPPENFRIGHHFLISYSTVVLCHFVDIDSYKGIGVLVF